MPSSENSPFFDKSIKYFLNVPEYILDVYKITLSYTYIYLDSPELLLPIILNKNGKIALIKICLKAISLGLNIALN